MARKKAPRFYTTDRSPAKSKAEIQELLNAFGVESYHVFPGRIGFVKEINGVRVPFAIQPNIEGLRARFSKTGVRGPKKSVEAVAWRQVQEMIELMLEMVESGQASFAEVFGGYALTGEGETVGQALEAGRARLGPETTLMLEGG